MPAASVLMRLLGFMVPCVLALAGVQPLIGAAVGAVGTGWAVRMSVPALVGAVVIFIGGRLLDRGDAVQPPWYSAWVCCPERSCSRVRPRCASSERWSSWN